MEEYNKIGQWSSEIISKTCFEYAELQLNKNNDTPRTYN
jgi:hypothetical protein